MDPLDIIKKSRCLNCIHRLTRVVEPVTQEDREYYMDLLGIEDGDTYDLFIEQHKCLVTDEDLDGIIRECSHFELKSQHCLIREYQF